MAQLLRILENRGVQYIVIGSIAMEAYGVDLQAADLDIVPDTSKANLRRLVDALRETEGTPLGPFGDWKVLESGESKWIPSSAARARGARVAVTSRTARSRRSPYPAQRPKSSETLCRYCTTAMKLTGYGIDTSRAIRESQGPIQVEDRVSLGHPFDVSAAAFGGCQCCFLLRSRELLLPTLPLTLHLLARTRRSAHWSQRCQAFLARLEPRSLSAA